MKSNVTTSHVIRIGPKHMLAGKYLAGPSDPKSVKRHGYGFDADESKAWPFPNERQAAAKVKVLVRHMEMWPQDFEVVKVETVEG